MGYVKRKCSNAGKVSVEHFEERKDEFLSDIKAEVVMNDIPRELMFNWDQTGVKLVPTGEWTIHQAKAKIIPIANSDDKRQITAVLAATLTGEYLPPQLIYKGKTMRCHPKVAVPDGWDVWHSDNHWSTETTMKRYIENVIVPFITRKRLTLQLKATQPALAIFDCFKGQTTPAILDLLQKHNKNYSFCANCTDKLQPMDVSINKPMKDEMKSQFQLWYASEVQKQLKDAIPINSVKVEVSGAAVKNKSANWIISSWHAIENKPDMAINGFRKVGILDAIASVRDYKD